MRDTLPGKEPQYMYMTDMDLVSNSSEWCVLAWWLTHKAWKSVVPGSTTIKVDFFQCLQIVNQLYPMTGVQAQKVSMC